MDWQTIQRRFAWIRALGGVAQHPVYHAEGDVLTHTHLVAAALAELEEWRRLAETERALLFAAALFHDTGKPRCTRVEADGRITSRGHARVGEALARYTLWAGEDLGTSVPFLAREAIARLVRFHGLPLGFLGKPDPERAVIEASQSVRLDWVALLAEADVRGRESDDRAELLERIALFRTYCDEVGCSTGPRAFASDHSRFRYFRNPQADPAYAAYDDTTFEVVLMSGLPGAGKDMWIREHLVGWPVVSLDAIRAELKIAPTGPQGAVAREAYARARALMRQREPFVWNATNITRALRERLVDFFASYHARVRIVYVDAPLPTLLRRNQGRQGEVPASVIRRLARRVEVPDLTEAHQIEWATA
jgi:putative nucleotidyltransferase with HDIG domain